MPKSEYSPTKEQTRPIGVQSVAKDGPAKPLEQASDEELIGLFQAENEQAFTVLVSRYKDPLMNFVYRMLGDRDDCEDVVQETFVRVYKKKQSYKPIARFSTWIYTIASNLAKTHLRRRKIRSMWKFGSDEQGGASQVEILDESASPERLADSAMKAARIQQALNILPLKYREVVVLRDVQDMQYEEIAAVLGMNIGTVKSRINRGRSMLQELLKDIIE
jgi:RNA polymerase sigma-70 factor (ECF subfamily)